MLYTEHSRPCQFQCCVLAWFSQDFVCSPLDIRIYSSQMKSVVSISMGLRTPSNSGSRETLERSEEDEDEADLTMDEIEPVRGNANVHRYKPNNDMLSIFDGPNNNKQYYSAYLCCAEEDMESFGYSFHRMLEKIGFKIFLPPRDLVLTGQLYENMARALEERCNGKIIVILSTNYADSEECLFLTYFARVLDPDARCKNIIPVQIDKAIGQLPSVLQGMSIIRYNQAFRLGWLKQKLIDAISA